MREKESSGGVPGWWGSTSGHGKGIRGIVGGYDQDRCLSREKRSGGVTMRVGQHQQAWRRYEKKIEDEDVMEISNMKVSFNNVFLSKRVSLIINNTPT